MNFKKIFLVCSFLIIICSVFVSSAKASEVSAPTILESGVMRNIDGVGMPYVIGLTEANTEVLIYIDGVYIDLATINSKSTQTNNFNFKYLEFISAGEHVMKIIARDKISLVMSTAQEIDFVVSEITAPTLIKPDEVEVIGKVKPFITGLTASNSFVHIYIDGVYNGKTKVVKHDSGTANFFYRPFLNLNVGQHQVWTIAEDLQGRKSKISNILKFNIEEPMPAPSILEPKLYSEISDNSPSISGLAKNNSLIKVFIDHQLNGQFWVKNHDSGTAGFNYRPFLPLTRGNHLVYTTATDNRGKESLWSNIIYFKVLEPEISDTAETGESEATIEIKESESEKKEPEIIISPDAGIIQDQKPKEEIKDGQGEEAVSEEEKTSKSEEDITDNDIKKLIEEANQEVAEESGLIDESRAGQSKLKWNLIIFIAFLFGVIAWIFWVNKELIKERRAKNKESEKNDPLASLGQKKKKDISSEDKQDKLFK